MGVTFGTPQYTSGTQTGGVGVSGGAVSTQASGSTFIMLCQGASSDAFTPSDSASNVYVLAGSQQNDTSDAIGNAMYYAANATGGSITPKLTKTSNGGLSFYFIEAIGVAASSVLDVVFGNTGLLGNPTSGPVTTTNASDGILSYFMANGGSVTVTPSGGFTVVSAAGGAAGSAGISALMTRIVTLTGTYDPNPSFAPSGGGTTIITAAFKAAPSSIPIPLLGQCVYAMP